MHTCGRRGVSSSNSEPERMHIPHEKEPPYLTGQSHLIDTRRVPNTSRPPIRHPLLSLPLFFSFSLSTLSFYLPQTASPFHATRISLSLSFSPSRSQNHGSASVAPATTLVALTVADFASSLVQSWKWKCFIRV